MTVGGVFLLGYFAHAVLTAIKLHGIPVTIADHWHRVNDYRTLIRDPKNYRYDPQTKLSSVEILIDPDPSLAALVAAGELAYVNLVLPTVPSNRRNNRYWMKWADTRDDVLEARGTSTYADFKVHGEQPLHLELWFRETARADVQKLIVDLESLAASEDSTSGEVPNED